MPAWRAVRVVAERGGRNRSDTLEAPFVGRDEELRQLKDLFHATAGSAARLVSVIGPGGHREDPPRVGVPQVPRRPRRRRLVARRAKPRLRRRDHVLGARRDGPRPRRPASRRTTRRRRARGSPRPSGRTCPIRPRPRWIEPALLALLGVDVQIASDQLFAAWRTFFERLAATAPVVMVFEDLHSRRHGPARLHRPPDGVEPGRPDHGRHARPAGAPGAASRLGRRQAVLHLDLPRAPPARRDGAAAGRPRPGPPAAGRGQRSSRVPTASRCTRSRRSGCCSHRADWFSTAERTGRSAILDERRGPRDAHGPHRGAPGRAGPGRPCTGGDAAVLGQSFSLAGLAAISGVAERDLEPRLRLLVRRELFVLDVDPRSPERGQYAFVQALIREVAYNILARRDRKVRHLAAARYFESLGHGRARRRARGSLPCSPATGRGSGGGRCAGCAGTDRTPGAAERAAALGSHHQALTFLEQALEITVGPR